MKDFKSKVMLIHHSILKRENLSERTKADLSIVFGLVLNHRELYLDALDSMNDAQLHVDCLVDELHKLEVE